MSKIEIDLKEVKRANYRLPSLLSVLDGIKRDIGLLRWRIPDQVQERKNIREDMERLLRDVEKERDKIEEIRAFTDDVVYQYMNTDLELNAELDAFK